jgi:TolB-like protein/Flp pilus assembly protein TadD
MSYASQDAEAAQAICEVLRAAGIEVWFDKSELRGGDVWDQKIRRQLRDCALVIAVISANTAARHEGYFRLEWDLADQRSHMMARNRPFIIPVCLDDTPESAADVPESFHRVQWTRLPGGKVTPAFAEHLKHLLSDTVPDPIPASGTSVAGSVRPSTIRRSKWVLALIAAVIAVASYLVIDKLQNSKPEPRASNPPPHSIAVLPFLNLSGDKDQEYFSDGLTEELLNALSQINDLQVAARTSAFSFKGKEADLATIASKLNVGVILEGSVRRSGPTIRITAELINAATGFHMWSRSYDRSLGDVLKLQSEIATAVAGALKVALLGDVVAKIELGGTSNPAAFDAYLRALHSSQERRGSEDLAATIAGYSEAIRLDRGFTLALAARSIAHTTYATDVATGSAIRDNFEQAEADARQALTLTPDLADAHVALAYFLQNGPLDFAQASEELERARALAPGNAQVLRASGQFAAYMGRFDTGIAAARRSVELDPLARASHYALGTTLYVARRYGEAVTAFAKIIELAPEFTPTYADRGFALYGLGDPESARASCETHRNDWFHQWCLAVVYHKLGRQADAEAELSKMKAAMGDAEAYQYATIYSQWGNPQKALDWLETAMRLRDPGLENLKTDPLLDPLHQEPRFQAIEQKLKFP